MRESVLICVDSGLNRQHIRGGESHAPPLTEIVSVKFSNGSVESKCNQADYICLHPCPKERRDRNQRRITNGRLE
jgi:hypothetical protein